MTIDPRTRVFGLGLLLGMLGCSSSDPEPPADPACSWEGVGLPPPGAGPTGPGAPVAFDDVTEALGLPSFYAGSASWGDVDGDGYPDLFLVGQEVAEVEEGRELRLYRSCPGGFVEVFRHRSEGAPGFPMIGARATSIADLDQDGRPDLLVAYSDITVALMNDGDLRFTAALAWAGGPDAFVVPSSIGVLTLDGARYLFISREDLASNVADKNPAAHNVVLAIPEDPRVGPWPVVTDDFPTIRSGGEHNTLAFAQIPRGPWQLPSVLWLGNDHTHDRAYLHAGASSFTELTLPPMGNGTSTMGIDWRYVDEVGTVQVLVSDIARLPLFEIGPAAAEATDRTHLVAPQTAPITWGVAFGDFDNDGDEDLVAAAGADAALLELTSHDAKPPTHDQRLLYFDAQPDGRLVEASGSAGPLFADHGVDYFSLVVADYDRDGCIDLVVSALELDAGGTAMNTPLRVLRNRCQPAGGFVGFLPPDDSGAVVALHTVGADGAPRVRYRAVKAASSIGARGEVMVHFGVGDDVSVDRVEVTWSDGTRLDLPPVALNGYHRIIRPD